MMNARLVVFLVIQVASACILLAQPTRVRAADMDPAVPPAIACVGDSPEAAAPPSPEGLSAFARPDVKAIAEQITCYCGCPHLQVSKCFCGTADRIRGLVATQIDQGMTPEAIIAAYVEEHGTWVLAEPPKRGFNWIIWIGPVLLVVFGAALLFIVGRRWVAPPSSPQFSPAQPALDSTSQARLRAQLEAELEREH